MEKYRLRATLPRRAPVAIWSRAADMVDGRNLLIPSFEVSCCVRFLLMKRANKRDSMESENHWVKDSGLKTISGRLWMEKSRKNAASAKPANIPRLWVWLLTWTLFETKFIGPLRRSCTWWPATWALLMIA